MKYQVRAASIHSLISTFLPYAWSLESKRHRSSSKLMMKFLKFDLSLTTEERRNFEDTSSSVL